MGSNTGVKRQKQNVLPPLCQVLEEGISVSKFAISVLKVIMCPVSALFHMLTACFYSLS